MVLFHQGRSMIELICPSWPSVLQENGFIGNTIEGPHYKRVRRYYIRLWSMATWVKSVYLKWALVMEFTSS